MAYVKTAVERTGVETADLIAFVFPAAGCRNPVGQLSSHPERRNVLLPAVVVPLSVVLTAVATVSKIHTGHRRCASKFAPNEDVSELPLVPTNEAPS